MGELSSIEWTDHTFNPWWGCTRVSPGCEHCYAESWAKRFGVAWGRTAERRSASEKVWSAPLRWNRNAALAGRPARVFCASMADVFEDRRDLDDARARLWDLIDATPNLIWLLLTKRPENILSLVPDVWVPTHSVEEWAHWPANVWVGTTVEDQRRADERIPHLLDVPAPVRFLSCEPLLGPVNLEHQLATVGTCPTCDGCCSVPVPGGGMACPDCYDDPSGQGARTVPQIHWVIAGGESGPHARPMHPDWARRLRDQATDAGVPFLFKQWGDWLPFEEAPPPFWAPADGGMWVDGHELPADLSDGDPTGGWWAPDLLDEVIYRRTGKKDAGRRLDGRTWDQLPEPGPRRPHGPGGARRARQ